MSEILYMKMSTQNIACSQRHVNMCTHHSVIHKGGGGGGGGEREADRQTETETQRPRPQTLKKKTLFYKNRSLG